MAAPTKPYRILSLDGGGIRGIITIELLLAIEQRLGPSFVDGIDLFAGTSTGGLIALGLASGKLTLTGLRDQYVANGGAIFASSLPKTLRLVKNLFTARHDNAALKKFIGNVMGDTRLGELQRKVLITSFDLQGEGPAGTRRWKGKFFHNLPGEDNGPNVPDSDWNRRAADVALYTASAPIYFPAADGYVDGGVVAPNPAMAALAQTQDPRYFTTPDPAHPQRKVQVTRAIERPPAPVLPDGIRLLAVGTGETRKSIPRQARLSWGFLRWIWPFSDPASPLVSLMIDGDAQVANYQCMQLLDDNFRRVQIELGPDEDYDLDSAEAVPAMQQIALRFAATPQFQAVADWAAANWW